LQRGAVAERHKQIRLQLQPGITKQELAERRKLITLQLQRGIIKQVQAERRLPLKSVLI
jgi:hypothetical protein